MMRSDKAPIFLIVVGVVLFISILFGAAYISPSDKRECVAWETTQELVTEVKPIMNNGSGLGLGLDGSIHPSFGKAGTMSVGIGSKYKDVERCTEWATPTPEEREND